MVRTKLIFCVSNSGVRAIDTGQHSIQDDWSGAGETGPVRGDEQRQ